MPVVPMVLVNGCQGIGTGYSSSVCPHKMEDIVLNTKACMRGQPMTDMTPWFRGYNGRVISTGKNTFITVGEYVKLGPDKIRVTELPVGAKNCKSYYRAMFVCTGVSGDHLLFQS